MIRFLYPVFGAIAEMDREEINERVLNGLENVKSRSRKGGRRKAHNDEQRKIMLKMIEDRYTKKEVCELTGVSRTTLYRYINESECGVMI